MNEQVFYKPILRFSSTVFLIAALFTSCNPTIHYVGHSYSPHPQDYPIAVFFDVNDINREYEVMGILKSDPNETFDIDTPEVTLKEMKKRARRAGGDAILIERAYENVPSSFSSSSAANTHSDGETITTTNTNINTVRVMEGKLLKFKD